MDIERTRLPPGSPRSLVAPVIVASSLFGSAAGPLAGQVAPADLAGCYETYVMMVRIDGDPARLVPADSVAAEMWPDRFRLGTERAEVSGIPVAFRARAIDKSVSDVELHAWWTAAGDSIVVAALPDFRLGPVFVAALDGGDLKGRVVAAEGARRESALPPALGEDPVSPRLVGRGVPCGEHRLDRR